MKKICECCSRDIEELDHYCGPCFRGCEEAADLLGEEAERLRAIAATAQAWQERATKMMESNFTRTSAYYDLVDEIYNADLGGE